MEFTDLLMGGGLLGIILLILWAVYMLLILAIPFILLGIYIRINETNNLLIDFINSQNGTQTGKRSATAPGYNTTDKNLADLKDESRRHSTALFQIAETNAQLLQHAIYQTEVTKVSLGDQSGS